MLGYITIAYVVLNIGVTFIIICNCDKLNFSFVNPFVIYKNIKMNWFGTILLAIIFNIMFPLIAVLYWFYKLVTVGRKDDEEK